MKMQRSIKTSSRPGLARRVNVTARPNVACDASKRVLITGGNSKGMGYQVALNLLKQDFEVTIASRDVARSEDAKAQLERLVPGSKVNVEQLDLSDLDSVRALASRLNDQEPLDVLYNNAGCVSRPRANTKQGFEMHWGTNYLGPYTLTSLLLPRMLEAQKPIRIVSVASATHLGAKLDFDDLNRRKWYLPWEAYGQSKLAIVMWTYAMSRRLQDTNITINCLHPGVIKTELGKEFSSVFQGGFLGRIVADLFFDTAEFAARTSVHLCSSPQVEGITGKYWADKRVVRSSIGSQDQAAQERLLEVSEQLTGVPPMPSKVPQYQKARSI